MMRLWLALLAKLALLCALVVGGIRALPYDDGGLRVALFSPECTPPCFMGIHPGVTTRDEVLAILRTSPWVDRVTTPATSSQISWRWSGAQPSFLLNHELRNTITFVDDVSSKIDLTLNSSLGEMLVTFGMPSAWKAVTLDQYYAPTTIMRETFVVLLAYNGYPVKVTVTGFCTFGMLARDTLYARVAMSEGEASGDLLNVERAPLIRMAMTDSCV